MVAVVVGLIVILSFKATGTGMFNIGGVLFNTLTWFAMAAALFSGLFFTADCLSEEKREGTMGFLFLTDLRGYDVVGGKLLTQSLRAFYGLLAVFPVLAMIMLMGGVSGAQFWKTNLALTNALICSLMSGLFVSARSTNSQKALAGTFIVLFLFAAAGPFVSDSFGKYALATSPIYVLLATYNTGTNFWTGLLLCQCIAWGMFAWTCLTLPRKWQETDRVREKRGWAHFWKFGSAKSRENRRRLMGRNPILWLNSREQWQTRWLWIGVLTVALGHLAIVLQNQNNGVGTGVYSIWWGYLSGLLSFVVYLWTASHATRFFADARRSGFLELLLATPLKVGEILGGSWWAFVRCFGGPLLVMVLVQLSFSPAVHHAYRQNASRLAASRSATAGRTNVVLSATTNSAGQTTTTRTNTTLTMTPSGTWTMPDIPFWLTLATTVASIVAFLCNLGALYWYGAWAGLTATNGNIATLKTFVFVMLIPWFVITFIGGIVTVSLMFPMFMGAGGTTSKVLWFPFVSAAVTTALKVLVDAAFISSSRRKLHNRFREQAVAATTPAQALPPIIQTAAI